MKALGYFETSLDVEQSKRCKIADFYSAFQVGFFFLIGVGGAHCPDATRFRQ